MSKLIFLYAFPLDQDRRRLWESRNSKDYPTMEVVRDTVKKWQSRWDLLEKEHYVLGRLTELTGYTFAQDIEVYVIGNGFSPMSTPFIIPIVPFLKIERLQADDAWLEVVIHELIHKLTSESHDSRLKKYWDKVRLQYKNEPTVTQNHIIVYAIEQIILTELFGEGRMRELITIIEGSSPDHQRAIDIVDESGTDYFLREFRGVIFES